MEADYVFYRVSDPNGEWSNFAPYPVYYRRKVFRFSEAAFQYDKFLGTNPVQGEAIRQAKTAQAAADLGRIPDTGMRTDWNSPVMHKLPKRLARLWQEIVGKPMLNKDWSMLQVVRAKVHQHPELLATLLATGNAKIIERTEKDRYWADGGDGTGVNMLGKILMVIRAEERMKKAYKARK